MGVWIETFILRDEETTYYEVRALYLDRLVIGTFSTSRELKIMDFTKQLSLYVANLQSSDLAMEVSKYLLLQRISKDLSKLTSMRPRLKELNDTPYIPI